MKFSETKEGKRSIQSMLEWEILREDIAAVHLDQAHQKGKDEMMKSHDDLVKKGIAEGRRLEREKLKKHISIPSRIGSTSKEREAFQENIANAIRQEGIEIGRKEVWKDTDEIVQAMRNEVETIRLHPEFMKNHDLWHLELSKAKTQTLSQVLEIVRKRIKSMAADVDGWDKKERPIVQAELELLSKKIEEMMK